MNVSLVGVLFDHFPEFGSVKDVSINNPEILAIAFQYMFVA